MAIKKRSGALTFYLLFMLLGYSILVLVSFIGLVSPTSIDYEVSQVFMSILLVLHSLGIVFVIYLIKWQKWAFWGLVIVAIGVFTVDIIGGDFRAASIKVLLGIAFLYFLLQTKKNGIKAWDNLESKTSLKTPDHKRESTSKVSSKIEYINTSKPPIKKKFTMVKNNKDNISIEDKYKQLKKLGEILDKGILTSGEFKNEKEIILNKIAIKEEIITERKFELLELIAELYDKNFISEDEFIKEKEFILNKTLKTDESVINKLKTEDPIDWALVDNVDKIHEEILVMKNDFRGRYNEKLYNLFIQHCTSKEISNRILDTYKKKYKSDIVDEITLFNSLYPRVEKYLEPFIDQEIIKAEYPHNRIKK